MPAPVEPYRLFIAYSRADEVHRQRLEVHLRQPIRNGKLTVWDDRKIEPGKDWDREIRAKIHDCDAVICLISADFINSDYVYEEEMEIAKARLERDEIDVHPIPISHALIEETWFGSRQALHNPEDPIGGLDGDVKRDEAWVCVVRKILAAAERAEACGRLARAAPQAANADKQTSQTQTNRFRRFVNSPLLSSTHFVGRENEIAELDRWLHGSDGSQSQRVFVLRALGGMGKSALAWQWSQDLEPSRLQDIGIDGVFWWSFYAQGNDVRAFADAALHFLGVATANHPAGLASKLNLLSELAQSNSVLFVLDGFERELRRFSRQDMPDDPAAPAPGPETARPFDCIDAETDEFLANIGTLQGASRWLMTTRVTPHTLSALESVREVELRGLSANATRQLFAAQGVTGREQDFSDMQIRFGGHALTLTVAARMMRHNGVVEIGDAVDEAGDVHAFWSSLLGETSSDLPADDEAERRLKVLSHSANSLSERARRVLHAFSFTELPPSISTLALIADLDSAEAVEALRELRSFGLVSQSSDHFVYEIHPVVREVASASVTGEEIERAIDAFEQLSSKKAYQSVQEAQPAIDLFHAHVRANQFNAAWRVYEHKLGFLFRREGLSSRCADLLNRLFDSKSRTLVKGRQAQTFSSAEFAAVTHNCARYDDALRVSLNLTSFAHQQIPDRVSEQDIVLVARRRLVQACTVAGKFSHISDLIETELPENSDQTNQHPYYTEPLEYSDQTIQHMYYAVSVKARVLLGRVPDVATECMTALPKVMETRHEHARTDTLCNLITTLNWARVYEPLPKFIAALSHSTHSFDRVGEMVVDYFNLAHRAAELTGEDTEAARAILPQAEEIATQFAAADLIDWHQAAQRLVALTRMNISSEEAAAAALYLKATAMSQERQGGRIVAAATWQAVAAAWRNANNIEAARASALRARELAYCEGPPFSAALIERQVDDFLAELM